MMGRTHAAFGITLGVAYYTTIQDTELFSAISSLENFKTIGTAFLGLYIGSLLPDIDHPTSLAGSKVKPLSYFLNKSIGHRTYTHALIAVAILVAITTGIFFYSGSNSPAFIFSISVTGGWIGHILLDMLTKEGVPLLYPFIKKRLSLLPIRTNSIWENLFMLLLLCANVYLLL